MISQIVEIGFEIADQETWDFLEKLLSKLQIPFYVQPKRDPPWTSLADLEAACEGK